MIHMPHGNTDNGVQESAGPLEPAKAIPRRSFGNSLRKRETSRVGSYFALLLAELAAINVAFTLAGRLRGEFWLLLNDIPVKWIFAALYVAISFAIGANTRKAFESRPASVMLGWQTWIATCAATCMFIFFTQSGLTLSRLALATAMILSIILSATTRVLFLTLFVRNRKAVFSSDLLITDGVPDFKNLSESVLDAQAEGINPDAQNPDQVTRIGELAAQYDRIFVACSSPERRQAWGLLLKSYDVYAEIIMADQKPMGLVGAGKYGEFDSLVVTRGTLSLPKRIQKRIVDVIFSFTLLMLALPFLALVALLVRLDSPGPILFRQPRVGYDNRLFYIFKFRSMRADSTDLAGARSTSVEDERITRFGRFIRATSIDELPQLLNVLIGDMSMVGPRPHALGSLAGSKLFWELDNGYWRRHALKPGITGLAQIRGYRGATHKQIDLENRLRSDIEYLDGWSAWRDIRIMLATLKVIVHPNAY